MAGDFVSAPRYPTPDYSEFGNAIGNLVNTYQGAEQNQQKTEQNKLKLQQEQMQIANQRAFANGVPIDPKTGQPDYAAALQMAAKTDPTAVERFAPILQGQQDRNAPVSPLLSGAAGGSAQGGGSSNAGGGRFEDALAQVESGNRNIPSTVDPDVAGPGTKSQGFFQINVPTWRDFAGKAGVDISQYPTPMSAPREVQERVAETIPFARFGPNTRSALEQKYGFGEDQKKLTIAELAARFNGGGTAGGQRMAYADNGARNDASPQPSVPPVSAAAGSRIPRANAGPAPDQTQNQPQGQASGAFGSPLGVRAAAQGAQVAQGGQQAQQGPSLASMIGNAAPPQVVANIAKAVGVAPDAPMSPEQAARAQKIVQSYAARTGGQQSQGGAQAQGQPQATQQQSRPIMPQVPLPQGFTDPQKAILAIDQEMARLSANPQAKGQVAALADWRDRIASATAPMSMGGKVIDPASGRVLYQEQEKPIVVGGNLVRPSTGEVVYEPGNMLLDKETISEMAKQARAGDTTVYQNLGRGAQGAQNIVALRAEVARQNKESGTTGTDQAMRNAEFMGVKAGQRTLGTKQAQIEMAATEFKNVLPVVRDASAQVQRSQYPSLNKIVQAWEEGTGDPKIVAFGGGVNTLVNLYSRAISPTGNPTVSDKEHAREILSKAWAQGQFDAAVGMMEKEIDAALNSPEKVRDEMRRRFGGGGGKGGGETQPATPKPDKSSGLPEGWSVKVLP